MLDCGHVFCRQCLQDFYNNAITEGDLATIRCLAPDCAKKRAANVPTSGKRRKMKTNISPSELLQIPIAHSLVKRYVRLKHKAEIESDKNTVYCPRTWCQGAARSKKHRKPSQDFAKAESSDEDSEDEAAPTSKEPKFKDDFRDQLLSICEDCSYAFCSRCYQGWHGVDKSNCTPRKPTGELTEEDKASLHYLQMHSTPCPTCNARAQKTHGCNHMICFKCDTHFCYLCSSWLTPGNPYQHFNNESTGCYQRLWELENGDGDDVDAAPRPQEDWPADDEPPIIDGGIAFPHGYDQIMGAGGVRPERIGLREFLQENPGPNQRPPPAAEPVEVAREGPLVLRLAVPPAPPPQVPDPPPAVPAPGRLVRRNIVRQPAPRPNPAQRGPQRGQQQPRANNRPGALQPAAAARPLPALNAAAIAPEGFEGQRAWVQQFVQLALRDEEDQMDWDSDDDEDDLHNAFEIPMRE